VETSLSLLARSRVPKRLRTGAAHTASGSNSSDRERMGDSGVSGGEARLPFS
jgi:hypothetical protein